MNLSNKTVETKSKSQTNAEEYVCIYRASLVESEFLQVGRVRVVFLISSPELELLLNRHDPGSPSPKARVHFQ
jgi:hypothetical protein